MAKELKKNLAKYENDFEVSIGINTGNVFVGNIGSLRFYQYKIAGDHVGIAHELSRQESSSGIVLSQYTYDEIKNEFICKELRTIGYLGKEINIFELI